MAKRSLSRATAPVDAKPQDVAWKGRAAVDRSGIELAVEMLDELENVEPNGEGLAASDYACLEEWPRQGRPFRNIVAEYLQRARISPEREAGFCAALSDFIALTSTGSIPNAEYYAKMFGIE